MFVFPIRTVDTPPTNRPSKLLPFTRSDRMYNPTPEPHVGDRFVPRGREILTFYQFKLRYYDSVIVITRITARISDRSRNVYLDIYIYTLTHLLVRVSERDHYERCAQSYYRK